MNNIVIFRTGSIGDTLIALPLFRYIRKNYLNSRIILLTNRINNSISQSIPAYKILENLHLIDEVIVYDFADNKIKSILNLIQKLNQFLPCPFFYASPEKGIKKKIQDYLFLKLLGIKKINGLNLFFPKKYKFDSLTGLYEPESSRLLRSVGIELEPTYEDFKFSIRSSELEFFKNKFKIPIGEIKVITISIGTRCLMNKWHNDNWKLLCRELYIAYPDYYLIVIGGPDEKFASDEIIESWPSNTKINLCGSVSLVDSACILRNSDLFIGHDSGPMHLAAAVAAPIVSIFSNRSPPGTWYPYGNVDGVIQADEGKSINSITVNDVMNKIHLKLEKSC